MLRYLSSTPGFFTQLKTVRLASEKSGETAYFTPVLDSFRSFFLAPNIEILDAVAMEPVIFAWPSSEPRCTALTTLILRQGTISEKTLERLLRCTPQLKHLTYDRWFIAGIGHPHWSDHSPEWNGFTSLACEKSRLMQGHRCRYHAACMTRIFEGPMGYREFNCRLLDEALTHVQSTLESLTIRLRFEMQIRDGPRDLYDPDWVHGGIVGRVRSLKEMERLETLEVPWVVLHGWEASIAIEENRWEEILPRGLKTLRMRDDTSVLNYYKYDEGSVKALVKQLAAWQIKSHSQLWSLAFLFSFDWRGMIWRDANQPLLEGNPYEGSDVFDEEATIDNMRRERKKHAAQMASHGMLSAGMSFHIIHEDAES